VPARIREPRQKPQTAEEQPDAERPSPEAPTS